MRFSTLAALALTVLLAACNGWYSHSSTPRSSRALSSYTYDAADTLVSRSQGAVNTQTPLLVATIGNVDDIESSSPFGRMVTEQISARLAAKGYNVNEMKLRSSINIAPDGEYILSRNPAAVTAEYQAAAAISGTYAVAGDKVLVNLRLIDVGSGRLVTAYDYTVPFSADVRALVWGGSKGWFGQSYGY